MPFRSASMACPEGDLRHLVAGLAGAGEEVGHVGVEPEVALLRPPEAEGAVRRLVGEDGVDRLLDAEGDLVVAARSQAGGEDGAVEIDERHGPADPLLGAAIGVAVEVAHHARDVEADGAGDRERRRARALHEAGEEIGAEVERAALRDPQGRLGDRLGRDGAHGQGEGLGERLAIGKRERDLEGRVADAERAHRHRGAGAAALHDVERPVRRTVERDDAVAAGEGHADAAWPAPRHGRARVRRG